MLAVAAPVAWRLYPGAGAALPGVTASGPAVAQAVPSAPGGASPLPQTHQAGALIATGYVVTRREATVAAEITGKVKNLLVEEGQAVEFDLQEGPKGLQAVDVRAVQA